MDYPNKIVELDMTEIPEVHNQDISWMYLGMFLHAEVSKECMEEQENILGLLN